jgi:hypothetical protein
MINEAYKHSALTEKIIGCAMKVHSALGNGFFNPGYPDSVFVLI